MRMEEEDLALVVLLISGRVGMLKCFVGVSFVINCWEGYQSLVIESLNDIK